MAVFQFLLLALACSTTLAHVDNKAVSSSLQQVMTQAGGHLRNRQVQRGHRVGRAPVRTSGSNSEDDLVEEGSHRSSELGGGDIPDEKTPIEEFTSASQINSDDQAEFDRKVLGDEESHRSSEVNWGEIPSESNTGEEFTPASTINSDDEKAFSREVLGEGEDDGGAQADLAKSIEDMGKLKEYITEASEDSTQAVKAAADWAHHSKDALKQVRPIEDLSVKLRTEMENGNKLVKTDVAGPIGKDTTLHVLERAHAGGNPGIAAEHGQLSEGSTKLGNLSEGSSNISGLM